MTLALQRADGHVLSTKTTRTAWFLLQPQRWSFRSLAECEALILAAAQRYAELGPNGRRVRIRVTSRPYAVADWARALDANTPHPLPAWPEFLVAEQEHMAGLTLSDKLVYVGVDLKTKQKDTTDSAEELAELSTIMAGPGFEGKPVTPAEREYLIARSVALGEPAPVDLPTPSDVLEASDVPELGSVEWTSTPYSRSLKVAEDRYVVVLSAGRMQDLHIPERLVPWLQRVDMLPFPVELAVTVDIKTTEQATKTFASALLKVRAQLAHFLEHHTDPPAALARQRVLAVQAEDEVTSGDDGLATRTHTWVRFAVSGRTEAEALDRARRLQTLYSPAINIVRGFDQYRMAREFIPGEPLANKSHERWLPVKHLAGAMPTATAMVGDRKGIYLGTTCGASERAVCWEPWDSMEVRERSGLTLIAGGLGAGKSVAVGIIVYKSAMRGIPAVVLDPSGPLGRLCDMPELRDRAQLINLLDAEPGTLNPYRVVPEPQRAHYASDAETVRARALAGGERRGLCKDVLMTLLPAALTDMPQTGMALSTAIRVVGGSHTASPRQVIDALRTIEGELAQHAGYLAAELDDLASMPQSQLIFPAGYQLDYGTPEAPLLTVLTLRGLITPKEASDPHGWSQAERFGISQLTLAATLTSRSIYDRPMDERKLVAFDEVHALSQIGSGRDLLLRTSRDSRKHNVRALLSSQNAGDVLTAGVGNLLDSALIGRTTDPKAQADALEVLGVERGVGYEAALAALSPYDRRSDKRSGYRDFVFSDGQGGIETIRPDLSGVPALARVLDTTADPTKVHSNSHQPLSADDAAALVSA
jgi:hypothetical protein